MSEGGDLVDRAVGNYVIVKELGRGAMGAVYLARHRTLATYVAVKVLREGAHPRMALRFRQEALITATLAHHRIARPLDIGQLDDGRPYIVMEHVEGRSLGEMIKNDGPLPLAAALSIAYRVADTMTLAHFKGVVHRDLKPSNVMVNERLKVHVLDFGVARATGDLKLVETAEGAAVGSAGYMAPEVVMGAGIDGRSDVFSLGVMLFEMLTGELPWGAPSRGEAALNLLAGPAPRLSTRRPAARDPIPPEVDALVERALARDPEKRMTMAELRGELYRLIAAPASAVEPIEFPTEEMPAAVTNAVIAAWLARKDAPARRAGTEQSGEKQPATKERSRAEARRSGSSAVRSALAGAAGTSAPPPPAWLWRIAVVVVTGVVLLVAAFVAGKWWSRSGGPKDVPAKERKPPPPPSHLPDEQDEALVRNPANSTGEDTVIRYHTGRRRR